MGALHGLMWYSPNMLLGTVVGIEVEALKAVPGGLSGIFPIMADIEKLDIRYGCQVKVIIIIEYNKS